MDSNSLIEKLGKIHIDLLNSLDFSVRTERSCFIQCYVF